MPKTILFWPDVYKEQGHWLPTLKWAEDMLKSGHTVNYMGIVDCEGVVKAFPIAINGAVTSFPYSRIFENIYPRATQQKATLAPMNVGVLTISGQSHIVR